MSTRTATSRQPRSKSNPEGGRYDQYVEEQLDKTRLQVKLVDLASSLMVLMAAVLGILLVLAIVDHWIVSFGAWGRWLTLLGLLGGIAWYVARVVVPLLFGRISSAYAARAIEKSEPSLKNSLINFLMFRSDRAGLRASVYQALRHQAAADLSHIQVETAVDRSGLIKIGYLLAGVLALCAAYTILSPKSTFQSAGRFIAPWADVAPPSRVRIEDVQPGNKELYHNEPVTVSANCYDVRANEPVTLFYSTLDGRLARESVPMQSTEAGLTYRCQLSPDGKGVQQDLVYWIEAGDARSPAYRLTVLPAPTILVERIEYEYPAYTGQRKKAVEQQGDIKGLEGTRVTLYASANVPIRSAQIEFEPNEATLGEAAQASDSLRGDSSSSAPERLTLEFDGKQAWGSFVLELDGTRTRPKHSFYQIRFTTEDGQRSRNPVLHRIEVTRDLSPEIEILTPTRDRIEVTEDGQQKIELRGIDPDYGLSRITLRAVAGGHDVATATPLDDPAGQTGQIVVGYEFKPSEHGLRAGDAVAYWAVAEDNRTSPMTGTPEPNSAKTRTYHMLIVPSEKKPGPENATPDAEEPVSDPSSPPSKPNEPTSPDMATSEDGSTDPTEDDGQKGDQTSGQDDAEGNRDSSDSSDSESGDTGQDGTGNQGSGSEPNSKMPSGTGATEGGQESADGGSTGESASDGSTGESAEGSNDDSAGGTPSGQSGNSGSGQSGTGGETGSQQQTGSAETGADPTGEGEYQAEPLHEGEAFEKALEHIRQQQNGDSPDTSASGGQATGDSKSAEASSGSQSSEGQDGGGHQEQPQQGEADGAAGGGEKPSDSPKAQGGQESEASGGAQKQQDGSGTPKGEQQQPDAGQDAGQPKEGSSGSSGEPKSGQQQPKESQGAGQRKESTSGSNGKPKGGAEPSQGKKPSSGDSGKPKGGGQGDSGKSGSGQKSEDKSGSAGSQQENRDGQQKKESQSGMPKPGSGSQSPSHSKRQSDSSGSEGGDRSGGGKEGGGQGAKQQGNDSAGSSSPGDDGKAASSESGSGDEANRPGDQSPSQGKTGSPGAQKGHGSASDPSPGGQGEGETADGSDHAESDETASGSPTAGATDERGQGIPMGGGKPSDAELQGFDLTGEVPPGEKPNLEYTRKAANLVLEHLKDQQDNPDQELLDKLGWTDEEMREFIARWESMKRAAAEDNVGKRELDEALRSLGLRPRRGTTRRVGSVDDQSRGLRDAGGQSGPPASIQEQFNAYKKGTARIERN